MKKAVIFETTFRRQLLNPGEWVQAHREDKQSWSKLAFKGEEPPGKQELKMGWGKLHYHLNTFATTTSQGL